MTAPEFDVVVLGGGPSGATTAGELAKRGRRVALVDPCVPVAPRIESLPGPGQRLAHALGLGPCLGRARVDDAVGINLDWRTLPEYLAFDAPRPLLLDRQRLHRALRDTARRKGAMLLTGYARDLRDGPDGVSLRIGAQTFCAQFVIDARGRRAIGKPRTGVKTPGLIGLAFFGTGGAGQSPVMHLITRPQAWIWMCTLANGSVSGALFLDPVDLGGLNQAQRVALARAVMGKAPLDTDRDDFRVARPIDASFLAQTAVFRSERMLRIGDAALARDPISSHGLTHAFRSAAHAVAAIDTMLDAAGATDAAVAFIQDRHGEAVSAAKAATDQAYADQNRFDTSFWGDRRLGDLPRPFAINASPRGKLRLAAPLRRAAVLEGERIAWRSVISLQNGPGCAAFVGPVDASTLAKTLGGAADKGTLITRVATLVSYAEARQIIEILIREKGLVGYDKENTVAEPATGPR
jgi:flavin-dependent dehydrogenase